MREARRTPGDHLPYGRCPEGVPPVQRGAHEAPADFLTSSRARLGRWPLSRPPPAPGPLPAPLREERRVPLHPRCLPSMCFPIRDRALTHPRSGVGQLSTGCPQPVECCCRRLCVPRMIPTGVDGAAGCEDSVCLLWTGPKAGRTRRADRSAPIDFCDQEVLRHIEPRIVLIAEFDRGAAVSLQRCTGPWAGLRAEGPSSCVPSSRQGRRASVRIAKAPGHNPQIGNNLWITPTPAG